MKFLKLDKLFDSLAGYIEDRIDLIKIEVKEELSNAIAKALVLLVLFLLGFIFLIFVSVSVALLIGEKVGSYSLGFGIVASIYLFFLVILIIFKKRLNLESRVYGYLGPFINKK